MFSSVSATTRDFESATTNMTFARLILAAAMNEPLSVADSQPFQLPSRPASMAFIQYYLDNVFTLFPVFNETSLFNALDAVYQVDGRPVTDFEHWLLYTVLAIGSIAQSRSNRDTFYADGVLWIGRALCYADTVLMPGYVSQIQALVLLVQYSMLDPAHFDSWQLIGFACRAVVDLGFHQDPAREQHTDKKQLELRRKIFYCVYTFDRYVFSQHTHFSMCQANADIKTSIFQSLSHIWTALKIRVYTDYDQIHQYGARKVLLLYRRCYKCCSPITANIEFWLSHEVT